jgi:hypothetical protein
MRRIFTHIKDRMGEPHLIVDAAPLPRIFSYAAGSFSSGFSGVAVGVG